MKFYRINNFYLNGNEKSYFDSSLIVLHKDVAYSLGDIEFEELYSLSKEKSAEHIKSGVKKVLVSAPCKGAINIVFGVNHSILKKSDQVISAASCTTNCLAPVAHVINE